MRSEIIWQLRKSKRILQDWGGSSYEPPKLYSELIYYID